MELTATKRVGLHKYTFPVSQEAAVVFDLENGGCWDKATETAFVSDGLRLSGYRYSTGWAKDQRVYFTAEFSKPVKNISYPDASETVPEEGDVTVKGRYARVEFDTTDGEPLYMKVAISPVSIENAKLNMQAELPGWDFEATARPPTRRGTPSCGRCVSRLRTKPPAASSIRRSTTRWSLRRSSAT